MLKTLVIDLTEFIEFEISKDSRLCGKDIGIRRSEFVAKIQFQLRENIEFIYRYIVVITFLNYSFDMKSFIDTHY